MPGKLVILDSMALAYRAHFALIRAPIRTSSGLDTSAAFGFLSTLLDLREKQSPTHLAAAFDTDAPTPRHEWFPEYKAHRDEMPEALAAALPWIRRLLEAFRVPVLALDGWEADDILGTLARRAETEGFETLLVTPDKDCGQLVDARTRIYKPGRQGAGSEILGPEEICARWSIQRPGQVIDILGLMGDATDNIPGIPGFGEKTAIKLIAEFETVEGVIAHAAQLKGRQRELVEKHADQALLSKKLATILCGAPVPQGWDALALHEPDEDAVRALFVELEFNSLGRRLFGPDFKAGRGHRQSAAAEPPAPLAAPAPFGELALDFPTRPALKTLADVPHDYRRVEGPDAAARLARELAAGSGFAFDLETTSLDPKTTEIVGVALAPEPGRAFFVAFPPGREAAAPLLDALRPLLANPQLEKTGHNLKFDLGVLRWNGVEAAGPFFDTMLAHALAEPEERHTLDFAAERHLGYTPIPITRLLCGGDGGPAPTLRDADPDRVTEYACEDADVALRLRAALEPLLRERGQLRVFHDIETPLLPALAAMEHAGIALDTAALAETGAGLEKEIARLEARVMELAGTKFNLNSPKQLGQILFEILALDPKAKKTRTGQFETSEAVLQGLAPHHEIARLVLEYREAAKLKSTYIDALPAAVFPGTGRVHTSFSQVVTATGRLASQNPNLQNIPIRTEQGREIRRAFVPRAGDWVLMSSDYSQIELRIMAALSGDAGLREAFERGQDIHQATAARVYGVQPGEVTPGMRRAAKTVNFGILYGISAFGLAQRLGIPRSEAAALIDGYFARHPGVKEYMAKTAAFCRAHGYVETLSGRRRWIRDIDSRNAAVRGGAERNAINAPIQGTAADMIKIAMGRIHAALQGERLRSRMLLQVHDELVFEVHNDERDRVRDLAERHMRGALPLPLRVPVAVETGFGANWLEAH